MFTKIKQQAKQKVHHYADKLLQPSFPRRVAGHSASISRDDSGAVNVLAHTVTLPTAASGSNISHAHPASLSTTRRISDSQSVAVSVALPSTDPASAAAFGLERSDKTMAWTGLKTLIGLLSESTDAFGALKSAIGGISRGVEIYERAGKGHGDYRILGEKLDTQFGELAQSLSGPTPPAMSSAFKNLAKGIEREIGFVLDKEGRSNLELAEDADEILECYRRIQRLLERVSFSANVNIWKTMDEQEAELQRKGVSPSVAAQLLW
ncbi:hypothetical protein BDV93DRAFT_558583 [Ceratobasidium sp. AG-I]|nr:hypothetical protein BDV93DRAFT_558583 [Ceratobasidium sp. AG-I]